MNRNASTGATTLQLARAKGLCISCDNAPEADLLRCRPCLDHENVKHRIRRARLRKLGVCQECGQWDKAMGFQLCRFCIPKKRRSASKSYHGGEQKPKPSPANGRPPRPPQQTYADMIKEAR